MTRGGRIALSLLLPALVFLAAGSCAPSVRPVSAPQVSADLVDDIQPAAVQSLSALWSNDWPMFVVGAAIFMLAAGLSIVRHGGLPRWMGWIAILLGDRKSVV